MLYGNSIWVGTTQQLNAVCLLPALANRHGLISGATGTGKTVTLQVLAEGFSAMGVPVFMADVKGDLSGMALSGSDNEKIAARLRECGVPSFSFAENPVTFWDLYGEKGHPVRATVSEMGPVLLGRMLGLNETQSGILDIIFHIADDEGMLLLDIRDLKAILQYAGENSARYTLKYGNIATSSIGAIQRAITVLEDQGGDRFFGEPALKIEDWLTQDESGRGTINVLAADRLFRNPTMYSTFMLWMLSEVYERLPEVGDLDKPRMVFFFDEAHLLFSNCGKALLEKINQVVRLVRSKGVGVYFVTQSPSDLPMSILGQLGNRIQHALRAYTPLDQKAVKIAAQTFRANPAFSTEEAITSLQTGEALISFLDAKGAPGIVEKATILPPQSQIGIISEAQRRAIIEASPFFGVYDQIVDRFSAYEMLVTDMNDVEESATPSLVYVPEEEPVSYDTDIPSLVYHAEEEAPAEPAQAAPQAAAARPQGFMVFDPATGTYVQKELPSMTPLKPAEINIPAPKPAQAPVLEVKEEPAAAAVTQQTVLVYDPVTGQYKQQVMNVKLDPATGTYMPVGPAQAPVMDPKEQARLEKEAEKARKEAERLAKEEEARKRRERADELREERAARAKKNDSVVGRVTNTAIATATREVTRQITRGIMGSISGIFGKKK